MFKDHKGSISKSSFLLGGMLLATFPLIPGIPGGSGDKEFNQLLVHGNTFLATDEGNVGVGTTSPGDKLDVADGSILATNLGNGGAKLGNIEVGYKEYYNAIRNAEGLYINHNTNANVFLVTGTSSGNVGIGTTNPEAKLDVAGSVRADNFFSSGSNSWVFHTPDDGRTTLFIAPDDDAGGWAWWNQYQFQNNGVLVANGYSCNSSRELKKDIKGLTEEDYSQVLKSIDQLEVVRYRYKEDSTDKKLHIGLIAEDSPRDILSQDGKSVSLYDSVGYLLAGTKALIEENQKLSKKLNTELAALKEEIQAMKSSR